MEKTRKRGKGGKIKGKGTVARGPDDMEVRGRGGEGLTRLPATSMGFLPWFCAKNKRKEKERKEKKSTRGVGGGCMIV